MTIILKSNKQLFAMHLLIALLEKRVNIFNNRKLEKLFNSLLVDKNFKKLISKLRANNLNSNSCRRFINLLLLPPNSQFIDEELLTPYQNLKPILNSYMNSDPIEKFFQLYCEYLTKFIKYKNRLFQSEAQRLLRFFRLPSSWFGIIYVHINALDSLGVGNNYFRKHSSIISVPTLSGGTISLSGFRHELMHIILKKLWVNNLTATHFHLQVPSNYQTDSLRVQFDEYFIVTANIFFLPADRQSKQLEYLAKHGFSDINIFYNFLRLNFLTRSKKLEVKLLKELLDLLEKQLNKL